MEEPVNEAMIPLVIDGQRISVPEGTTILEAARGQNIPIPTLCHHPALEPYGACRLCTVEMTERGRTRLVTSCNYPIRQEMEVQTASEKVLRGRRLLAELLLARCPTAPDIRALAAQLGVTRTRFESGDPEELCHLCGLCVRTCAELVGQSAISFVGRGVEREVGTPFLKVSDDCIACGACEFVCPTGAIKLADITDKKPIPLLSDFNMGLGKRGNIFIPFPQAVPKVPVIDREHCLHHTLGRCGVCEVYCQADAIVYDQEDEFIDVEVESVIVATGFDTVQGEIKPELGYGTYPEVISGLEFERLFSSSGPTGGKIRIGDMVPQDIVFIHCVGSRDSSIDHPWCSRVCCMYTAKQAHLAMDRIPGVRCTVFYMDVRTYGKGFEEFYDRVREEGVVYRRGNPAEVLRRNGRLVVRAEDTLLGDFVEVEADMVVLATGLQPRPETQQIADMLGLELTPDGFFEELHYKMYPVDTNQPQVFLAGCAQGPKDVPDTVAQAKAAASSAMIAMRKKELARN